MEKLKNKHDHALTQWLKVIIFAILMMAPFFSVLSRCLYVTCNKNAKDSYSDTYIEKYSVVNQASMLVEYNKYQVLYNGVYGNYSPYINVYDTDFGNYINLDPTLTITTIYFVNEANYARINLNLSNGESMRIDNWNNYTTSFYITYKASNINTSNTLPRASLYLITYDNDTLDNAFEYSVNQLTKSQTFNWVTNTAIYQPVNAMTTGLGFDANNNIVALLLTYWAILTAVYVLFDIIISCFVKLTHLISGNS